MSWLIVGFLVLSLIAGGGAVVAADDALPGDALYGLDQALEAVQINVAPNAAARVKVQKVLAAERLYEAEALEAAGKTELSQEAWQQYEMLETAVNVSADFSAVVDDDPEPTATATMTPTVTITPTVIITPTVTVTPTITATPGPIDTTCAGDQQQPHAQTLADQYEVSYDEIMGWFCAGNGFGEIELAYGLSLVDGQPVAEIFALREAGQGWGEIKKTIEGSPSDNAPGQQNRPEDPGNPGNSDNPGNSGNAGNNGNNGNSGNNGNNGNGGNNGNNGNNGNSGNTGNNGNGNGRGKP